MDTQHADISIIIPVWNNWEMTKACLHSLHQHTHGVTYHVILVDNASTDDTSREAPALGTSLFGESFTYLSLPENLGFAKACNQGAWASKSKYLFFLNNDTTVTPGWLPPLVSAMHEDKRLAGVGPLLLFPEDGSVRAGRVQHLGITISHGPEFRHLYELFPPSHPAVQKRRKLNVITAAALLIPAALFKAENGFHEGFVNGMEDVDLCCRVARRGGYFSVIPDSVIHHHTGCTAGRFDREADNLRLLLQRCRDMHEDINALVVEDGFELDFTPWLDSIVKLPDASAAQLKQQYQDNPTQEHLNSLLTTEPLWDEGYVLLVNQALIDGDLGKATITAYLRSLLCPSLAAYQNYIHLMKGCDNPDLIKKNETMLTAIENAIADRQGLAKKAQDIMKSTRNSATLEALKKTMAKSSAD